jgi:hypothetical protein
VDGLGIGVGPCSSVIPYVTDQLAMARLPRATFALMLARLPATATLTGLLVLHMPGLRTPAIGRPGRKVPPLPDAAAVCWREITRR